jgi:hypothetical protein
MAVALTHLGDAQYSARRPADARESWEEARDLMGRLPAQDVSQLEARLARLAPAGEAASA